MEISIPGGGVKIIDIFSIQRGVWAESRYGMEISIHFIFFYIDGFPHYVHSPSLVLNGKI